PPGDYRVKVISARVCFDTMDVTIGEPDPLTATATATPFECNVNNDVSMSTITLNGDGGTEPYKYKFENGGFGSSNTFNVFDTGSDQTINYWVRDANGCVVPGTIVIQPLNTFELNLSEDTAIGCGNDGLVTLSVVNERIVGDTYSFELLPVGNTNGSVVATSVTATSAQFELYNPGNYTFKVTNDTTGCYELIQHEILPFDLIDVVAVATLPAVCFDDVGTLEFTVSGNAGAYSYEVFRTDNTLIGTGLGSGNGIQTFTHPDLVGGNYFVRVAQTDHPDCSEDSNVITIVSPNSPLTVTASEVANVTCTNDQGEIIVTPTGGYAPYDIELTHTTDPAQTYFVSDVSGYLF